MPSQPDYYTILEVSPTASPEVITSAYRSLARKYHPDANSSPEADAKMKAINSAYDVLGDRSKRADYDRQRTTVAAKPAPPRTPSPAPPQAQPVMQAHSAPPPPEPALTLLQKIGAVLASPAAGIFVIAFIIAYLAFMFVVYALALWMSEEWVVLLAVLAASAATWFLRRPRK